MKEYCVMLIITQLNERIMCYANNYCVTIK